MVNLLTQLANKPAAAAPVGMTKPEFSFNTEGKITPLEDKGRLLPSRIFGSPSDCLTDFGHDIANIGKAVKGKANDHELGRINDVAMKAGALALAGYLCVKNPLKLSKAMEFTGVATFFGSMVLWPKLAIQAPLKARTGVDIHQKYIDSQGRKKMLFQDPQYVLTDLYSKEDLDKMGKKLNVNENLPDRDRFIKQRAQKTALQGNTLWMLSAGIATPVMSALGCNVLEKHIGKFFEQRDLKKTQIAVETPRIRSAAADMHDKAIDVVMNDFLKKNADKPLDKNLISELVDKITEKTNSPYLKETLEKEFVEMAGKSGDVKVNETFVIEALSEFGEKLGAARQINPAELEKAIESGSINKIAKVISENCGVKPAKQEMLEKKLAKKMQKCMSQKTAQPAKTLGEVTEQVKIINKAINRLNPEKKVLDDYISQRVGDKAGTYQANHWSRFTNQLFKSLKIGNSEKELKKLAENDYDFLAQKFSDLAQSDGYEKAITDLMKLTGEYEEKAGDSFIQTVRDKAAGSGDVKGIFEEAAEELRQNNILKTAEKLSKRASKNELMQDTIEKAVIENAIERAEGARSSFYRTIQSIELQKRIQDGTFAKELEKIYKESGKTVDENVVKKMADVCSKALLTATTTEQGEKFMFSDFKLTEKEYKAAIKLLFGEKSSASVRECLEHAEMDKDKVKVLVDGFDAYKSRFIEKVANFQNGMTPELGRRVATGCEGGMNAIERNNIVGKPVNDMIKEIAKNRLNSNKWLKIFGGTMIALTAVTVAATFAFGKKGDAEKQAEAEAKKNE